MNQISRVVTDPSGLVITQQSGVQFSPLWIGLPFLINGVPCTIASVDSPISMRLTAPVGPFLGPAQLAPIRETIYQAFFNLVKTTPGIRTASRTPQLFSNIDDTEKPYLFVEQMGENPERPGQGMPYNWQFELSLGICAFSPDPINVPPVTLLNPILDALEVTMNPSPTTGHGQTLGDLVNECRLMGNGHEAAGALGNQAWAYIPVRIFAV